VKNKRGNPGKLFKIKSPEGTFTVLGVAQSTETVWIEGVFPTLAAAKNIIKEKKNEDVIYYVHNDLNRVIYSSKD